MPLLKSPTHFDFMGKRWFALTFSGALILITVISLLVRGMNFGLDFTGGVLVEVDYGKPAKLDEVRRALADAGYGDAVVQSFGTASDVLIRLPPPEEKAPAGGQAGGGNGGAEANSGANANAEAGNGNEAGAGARARRGGAAAETGPTNDPGTVLGRRVVEALRAQDPNVTLLQVQSIGAQVGEDLADQASMALLVAFALVFVYVMIRFRWKFAAGAILALVHDVIVVVGWFSIFGLTFDLTVLAAVLAVIGYSLNDTIVVYDRIRENFRTMRRGSSIEVMNAAINQTLSRTINTSLTVILVLVALLALGGQPVRGFSIALIVGTVMGTYSSIYIASALTLLFKVTPSDMMPAKREVEVDALP
ncbi:MAG TPA: protein translocase subunit SecF [Gammaproteobacteria bacterium]|nr:protein translocase subunit SecF [Gammaproteobacteria bacterium]